MTVIEIVANDPPIQLPFHPLADLFPLIEGAEFGELVTSIKANGLREPVVLFEEAILDGRNRYLACFAAGVDPRFEHFRGSDAAAFVIDKNIHRRHLTESQRAMVAGRLANLPQGARTDLAPIGAKSDAEAAEMLNVGERSVERAKTVQRDGAPSLVAAVNAGEVSVSAAADVATLPVAEQAEIVARGPKEILEAAKAIRAERVETKRTAQVERSRQIAASNAALPATERKYGVIYADPPWSFKVWSGEGADRAAENHYPTMRQPELEALPVGNLAADDCALFMWAVMPQLPEALRLIEAWGFEYKTCAFVWTKLTQDEERFATGMGYWTRANAEVCLLATRGSPTRLNADVHQVVATPRMEHSRKPDEVADRIERLVPGPYIELFSRRSREGWDAWGNQASEAAV